MSPKATHSAAPEPAAEHGNRWLGGLLARLGLPGAPSLRETLEEALKGSGDGRTFTAEEREMLLRQEEPDDERDQRDRQRDIDGMPAGKHDWLAAHAAGKLEEGDH